MNKSKYIHWLLFVVMGLAYSSSYAQSIQLKKKLESKNLHIAAHRGAHQHFPENSIPAINEAIKLGITIVELDIRSTKDGVLILMHDKMLDRTTTGKGDVSNFTYAEIQGLRLLTPHGEPTPYRIPTLKEALKACKNKLIVDIDFKEERKEYIAKAYLNIQEEEMEDQVLFFLYNHTDMASIYKLNPKITLFPRARNMADLELILESGLTSIIHIDDSFNDVDYLNGLKQKGITLWLNSLGEIDKLALEEGEWIYISFLKSNPFIKIVQTDNPDLWRKITKGQ